MSYFFISLDSNHSTQINNSKLKPTYLFNFPKIKPPHILRSN